MIAVPFSVSNMKSGSPGPWRRIAASAEGRASNSRNRGRRSGDDYESRVLHGKGHSSTSAMNKDVPANPVLFVFVPGAGASEIGAG
jgi:hypothetical protein